MGAMLAAGVGVGVGYVVHSNAIGEGIPDTARLTAFLLSFWGLIFVFLGNLLSTGSTSLIAAALSPIPLRRRLAFSVPAIGWPSILALAIATTALGHFLGVLVHLLGFQVNGSMTSVMQTLTNLSTTEQLVMLTMIGLLVPITEELLFRGYIQTRLVARHGPFRGILITSVLFGVMHMNLYQSPATFFLGLMIGFAAWYGRSIVPAIAAHMVNNTIAIGLMLISDSQESPSRHLAFIWLLASAVLVLLGFGFALWRGRRVVGTAPPISINEA